MNIPEKAAHRIVRDCVCSFCWGLLSADFDKDTPHDERNVHCFTPGCACPGFISAKSVQRILDKQKADYAYARDSLSGSFPQLRPQVSKSEEKLIKDLGF